MTKAFVYRALSVGWASILCALSHLILTRAYAGGTIIFHFQNKETGLKRSVTLLRPHSLWGRESGFEPRSLWLCRKQINGWNEFNWKTNRPPEGYCYRRLSKKFTLDPLPGTTFSKYPRIHVLCAFYSHMGRQSQQPHHLPGCLWQDLTVWCSTRDEFSPQETFGKSGDIFSCHTLGTWCLLVSNK